MNFNTRLILAFVAPAVLFVASLGGSIWALVQTQQEFDQYIQTEQAMANSVREMYAQGLQMGQALRNIVLDPANPKAYDNLQAALSPRLAKSAPEAHEGALLRAVRWAIEDRDADGARARLAELPQGAGRRIQALRLKLRIARLGGPVNAVVVLAMRGVERWVAVPGYIGGRTR